LLQKYKKYPVGAEVEGIFCIIFKQNDNQKIFLLLKIIIFENVFSSSADDNLKFQ